MKKNSIKHATLHLHNCVADRPAPHRHKLIGRIRFKLAIKASGIFTKVIRSYNESIMELDIQLNDGLLAKIEKLLLTGKLWKKARKEVIFLQLKLTRIHHAFGKVGDVPADQLSMQINEWAIQARVLIYNIEHVVHDFLARRLRAADPPATHRHKLISRIEFKLAIADASRQFANNIQSYRDRIMEMERQLITHIVPAMWSMDSLLPKLRELLISGELQRKARKEVIFLQEKLTRIQRAFDEVEDVEWARKARALSYHIEHVVDKSL